MWSPPPPGAVSVLAQTEQGTLQCDLVEIAEEKTGRFVSKHAEQRVASILGDGPARWCTSLETGRCVVVVESCKIQPTDEPTLSVCTLVRPTGCVPGSPANPDRVQVTPGAKDVM